MIWWSVLVEFRAPEGAEPLDIYDERYITFVDLAQQYEGSATTGPDVYGARISVEAPSAFFAISEARHLVWKMAANSGLPEWPESRLEAMSDDELDQELSSSTMPVLMGPGEVAERLGVSRQRLAVLRSRPSFPRPIVVLKDGPIWNGAAIDKFQEERMIAPRTQKD